MAIKIRIKGFDPAEEVVDFAKHYGCFVGHAISAKSNDGHVWNYIFLGEDVRKPSEVEDYLFRSAR